MAGYLRGKGLEVLETREPGGTPESEALRDLLVQGDPDRWSALSELLLITAARVEHVNRLIEPCLDRRQMGDLRPLCRLDIGLSGHCR